MEFNQIFNNNNLSTVKRRVWQKSVIPYILSKKTNPIQKLLLWVAEHTLAGATIGILSISVVGAFAWGTAKDTSAYSNITEVVFKKDKTPIIKSKINPEKIYSRGTFQPIVVENDNTQQPLDKITSGSQQNKTQTNTDYVQK